MNQRVIIRSDGFITPSKKKTVVATSIILLTQLFESSDSDTDSENGVIVRFCLAKKTPVQQIPSNFLDIVGQYPDEEFKRNFRLKRSTFEFLLSELNHKLINTSGFGRKTKPPRIQLLVTFRFFANPDSYRELCNRFGVKNATAIRMVRRVVIALNSVRSKFIRWPENPEANAGYFDLLWGFPDVVRAVDGTHINIPQYGNSQGYVNRKGQASIQLQVVADHKMKFIHCYTGQAGSLHDARVLRLSGLQDICNAHNYFPNHTHLLGDAAYPIQEHLLVPWKDNGHLTPVQVYFNKCLSSARIVVERALGLLKGRWRRILRKLPMIRDDLIPFFIMACCVLHNICLMNDDEFDDYEEQPRHRLPRNNVWISAASRNAGLAKRTQISEELFRQRQ